MAADWMVNGGNAAGAYRMAASEERELELTLGLPGGERSWAPAPVAREVIQNKEEGSSDLSLGLFPKCPKSTSSSSAGGKRGFVDAEERNPGALSDHDNMQQQQQMVEDSHRLDSSDVTKACKAPPAAASAGGAVTHNRSQARSTTAPVVGWPPIRSFRKNIAASSSRLAHASKSADEPQKPPLESPNTGSNSKGVFVKINMDGIPIGRKIDLKSCHGYDNLSAAVDKLFRGLFLAAQKGPLAAAGAPNSGEESPVITGLLDGTGEYTLVYEDEEGDRILVGDVPWEMFITTAKRLRVLKTSELSKLSLGATSRKRAAPESGVC